MAADRLYLRRVAAGMALLGLCGCGSSLPSVDTRDVRVIATAEANIDSPVAVDLVLAMDADALQSIASLSAAQWFRERSQVTLAHPTGLRVQSFEVAPRHSVSYTLARAERDAVGAFVFANFAAPGTHRARVDRLKALTVRLGQTSFTVEPGS